MATLEAKCKNGESVSVEVGDDPGAAAESFRAAIEAAGGINEPARERRDFTMNERIFMALCLRPASPSQDICQAMVGAAEPVSCDRLLMRMLLTAEKPALQYAAAKLGDGVAAKIAASRPQLRRVA